MRQASKVDENQPEIVAALRKAGASVETLHAVGQGCPDLMVGYRGTNYALEVKDGRKPPSARGLTDAQLRWHSLWRGHVQIVNNVDEALAAIGIKKAGRKGVAPPSPALTETPVSGE